MKESVYAVEAKIEANHWWFVGRRQLVNHIIDAMRIPSNASVLDAGTGTGTNLRLLKELGFNDVTGVDQSGDAIRFCAEKGLGNVRQEDICNLSFDDNQFQLILATDIIEHVDEKQALKQIYRVLSPGGIAVFTVPAFDILWGLQDELSHHKKRYTKPQFKCAIKNVGFEIVKDFYFNYILFLPILIARKVIDLFNITLESENQINTPLINNVLSKIFRFDICTAPWLKLPFGVSIMVVVQKK